MASLEKRNGSSYRIVFRYRGKKFSRSLGTKSAPAARAALARLEDNLHRANIGTLRIPENADVPAFLLSDGTQPSRPTPIPRVMTLSQLFESYKNSLPPGSVEPLTQETMNIHFRHLERLIGGRTNVRTLRQSDIQAYVNKRAKETGRKGRRVSSVTIKKEIITLSPALKWAAVEGLIAEPLSTRDLKYPKSSEKPPFQTLDQIERRIARGGLASNEISELWECLFLDINQLKQLLTHVEKVTLPRFVYPMFAFAAYTGVRRSEMLRSQVDDVCFETGTITIREKKSLRGKLSTRSVPMAAQLDRVLKSWVESHPGGKYTFCTNTPSGTELTRNQAVDYFRRALAGSSWEMLHGWHTFRHSMCSNCAAAGLDQRQINGFVGHQTEAMVRRYRHLFPANQKRALAAVFD